MTQFSQPEITLPVVCPHDRQLLAISDITALATTDSLQRYKTAAIQKYIRENPTLVRCCPSPACSQILNLKEVLKATNEQEELRRGGREVVSCDDCDAKYCLYCSSRDQKAVRAHPNYLCREMTTSNSDLTRVSLSLSVPFTLSPLSLCLLPSLSLVVCQPYHREHPQPSLSQMQGSFC